MVIIQDLGFASKDKIPRDFEDIFGFAGIFKSDLQYLSLFD